MALRVIPHYAGYSCKKRRINQIPRGVLQDIEARNGSTGKRLAQAIQHILKRLYVSSAQPDKPLTIAARNELIRSRYRAGETMQALAAAFGISFQRVHQIIHQQHE